MSSNLSTCLNQFKHEVFLGSGSNNVMTTVLVMVKASCVMGAFCLAGRTAGNPQLLRDTTYLVVAVLFMHQDIIGSTFLSVLPAKAYLYVAATFISQVSTATVISTHSTRSQCDTTGTSDSGLAFLRPTVFPCRTTHTRLFPSKHSFSYSYLFVGIPIGWQDISGTLLSAGQTTAERGWLSVHDEDYLARGKHEDGLSGKLKDYLSSQNVSANQYAYAYLITAPRILGYSFNPVSFWYLYDKSKTLSAMILEVNNTFDERRMYFMQGGLGTSTTSLEEFRSAWSKDFHVSPFNDRNGTYSLKTKPLLTDEGELNVDNTIVLKDDAGKTKLVARVFSTEDGVDPLSMSVIRSLAFVSRWWWVGFMTNPRILREAWKLWFKQLQVYYRPEVYNTSIGRSETAIEARLEFYFKSFLVALLNATSEPITVVYTAAAGTQRDKAIHVRKSDDTEYSSRSRSLALHVLTPAFYGEIVRNHSIEITFARVCLTDTSSERMVEVSDAGLLRELLQNVAPTCGGSLPKVELSCSEASMVSALRKKRSWAFLKACCGRIFGKVYEPDHLSEYDCLVSLSHSPAVYKAYLHIVQRLLLIEKIAFGFEWLLDFYRHVLRITCLALISRGLVRAGLHSPNLYSLIPACMVFHYITTIGQSM